MISPIDPRQKRTNYLSQQRPKKGVSDLLNTLFTVNRLFEVFHTIQGRRQAQKTAIDNEQRIDQGIISEKLENSRLGTLDDAATENHIGSFFEGGLYLGFLNGHPIFCRDDWHILCVAKSGAGKSTSICIPNIITLGLGDKSESCFVFDIKGELYHHTAKAREQLDQAPPLLIDDFDQLGGGIRLNFLDDLIERAEQDKPILETALGKLALQYGDLSKRGANAWIAVEAMEWNLAYLIYSAELEPENCHPGGMADFSRLTHQEMTRLFNKIRLSNAGDGAAADIAKNWLSDYAELNDQFGWIRSEISSAWALYGKGSILRHKRTMTDFDIRTLKQQVRTIYYHFPATYIRSHNKDAAALLDYLIGKLAKAKGDIRTTIMADEFVNFPAALSTVTALRLYRSEGIRLFVFAQDENGFNAYQDQGGIAPFKENAIGIYFGIDGKIAKDLSDKAGKKSVLIATGSTHAGINNTGGIGSQEVTTPVLPLSNIAQNVKGKAYLDMRDRIYCVDRPAWWDIPEIKELME